MMTEEGVGESPWSTGRDRQTPNDTNIFVVFNLYFIFTQNNNYFIVDSIRNLDIRCDLRY